jgi:hypothetical protein
MQLKTLFGLAAFLSVTTLSLRHAEAITVPGDYPTIQAALTAVFSGAAPNGSVINVQPGTYNESLLINNVSASVTVRGINGAASTIINASGTGQPVLRIYSAPGALQFDGLTLTGGTGGPGTGGGFAIADASPVMTNMVINGNTALSGGGGVLSRSNAQFIACRISSNFAAQFGGGMVITTGSRPVFSNSQIVNNVSGLGGAGVGNIGSGGGVHINDASPVFRGSVINGNQSKFAGGGITLLGSFTSAYGTALLVLEDTDVSNNVSTRFSNADNPAEGGGINIEDNSIAYLIRAHVSNNSANTGGGLNGYRARYEVTSSIIENNHAPDPLSVGGFGGGINMSSNNLTTTFRPASSLVLTDSVVRNNDSRIGGGILLGGDAVCGSTLANCPANAPRASMQVVDSLISGNFGSIQAGGIRLDRADATISNSHILTNSVAANGASYAGGLLMALRSIVTISGTTIARNAAGNFGGGLFVDDGAVLNLTNSQVYANTAATGGAIYVGSVGAPSGTVQGTTIADNSGAYQIQEQACGSPPPTILRYVNNVIAPGGSGLYSSTCGLAASVSDFNAVSPSRTSGNSSGTPSFATFLATPDFGPTVLSWAVARASSVNISGSSFQGDVGTVNAAPTTSTTYTLGSINRTVTVARSWGGLGDTPLSADFDGDGRKDLAVYRGTTGEWFILGSSTGYRTVTWGAGFLGDIPVPADYDGDGRADIAVFRQATGQWFILRSSNSSLMLVSWGAPSLGDVPVPADYDGDHKADVAVYRLSSGQWFVSLSSNNGLLQVNWGAPSLGDLPVNADYDGDGKADVAVYRQSTGQWFILRSSNVALLQVNWGGPSLGDTPVPADYDGDGKADIAVARPLTGQWFIRGSLGGTTIETFGYGDVRLPGAYEAPGRAKFAIWRSASGTWLIHP